MCALAFLKAGGAYLPSIRLIQLNELLSWWNEAQPRVLITEQKNGRTVCDRFLAGVTIDQNRAQLDRLTLTSPDLR